MYNSNSWKRNIVCLGWNGQSSVCNFKLSGLRRPHWDGTTRAKIWRRNVNHVDICGKSSPGSGSSSSKGLMWALAWQVPATQGSQCGSNRVIWGKRTEGARGRVEGTAFWWNTVTQGIGHWNCSPNGTVSKSNEVQYQLWEDSDLNYWFS